MGAPEVAFEKSGEVTWRAKAQAFGETHVTLNTIDNPLRFPGQYFDQETGLYQNYFRDYDSRLGRYIQGDPIGLDGGANIYGYAELSPTVLVDYYGMSALTAAGIAVPVGAAGAAGAAGISGGAPSGGWSDDSSEPGRSRPTRAEASSRGRESRAGSSEGSENPADERGECKTCNKDYPEYKKCSSLAGYFYTNRRDAFMALGGHKIDGARPSYGGPCAGTPGQGSHWNVKTVRGMRAGSIVSCTCCQDGVSAVLVTRYKAVY